MRNRGVGNGLICEELLKFQQIEKSRHFISAATSLIAHVLDAFDSQRYYVRVSFVPSCVDEPYSTAFLYSDSPIAAVREEDHSGAPFPRIILRVSQPPIPREYYLLRFHARRPPVTTGTWKLNEFFPNQALIHRGQYAR